MENPSIYIQMQDVDEFHITGHFKNWEFRASLPDIKLPVLETGGMNNERNPEDTRKEGHLIPNSRTYLCPDGSHMSMYDGQMNDFTNLVDF